MAEETNEKIGRRLRLTREAVGLNQAEFAVRAGLSPSAYNQYETGTKRPSIESAVALCETYDLTLDWIYRGDLSGLRHRLADAIQALRSVRRR